MAASVERVDVDHHGGWAVDCCPGVCEELLGPSTKLVAGAAAIGNFLNSVTVADPAEVGAPDARGDAGEGPLTTSDFADE